MKILRTAIATGLLFCLAACFETPPKDEDIKAAMQSFLTAMFNEQRASALEKISDVKCSVPDGSDTALPKIQEAAKGNAVFQCHFTSETRAFDGSISRETDNDGYLVKIDGKWHIAGRDGRIMP